MRDSITKTVEHRLAADSHTFTFALTVSVDRCFTVLPTDSHAHSLSSGTQRTKLTLCATCRRKSSQSRASFEQMLACSLVYIILTARPL